MQEAETPFGKTHNLSLLLNMLKDSHQGIEWLRPTLAIPNAYAVEYRYLGESADKEVARQAVKLAEEVKQAVLEVMPKTFRGTVGR